MTTTATDGVINAGARGMAALFDGGSLKVYTAGQGVLLLTYTLNTPAFALGVTAGREETAGVIATPNAVADGNAADYVLENVGATQTIVGTGEVTLVGGGGTLELNAVSLAVTTGQAIELANFFIEVS